MTNVVSEAAAIPEGPGGDGVAPQPANDPGGPADARIGRYEILGRIGAGGMAEIFRARAHGPGGYQRELIIKRILPHRDRDPTFIESFVGEAKILGMLNHPNIVGVYDFGEDAGRHYLALEYLNGPSLAEIMSRRQRANLHVPIGAAAFIAHEICRGLEAVHSLRLPNGTPLDVIHRDVTPSNVMTTRGGAVKLLDFGIAKIRDAGTLTRHGQIKGKVAYLAPEQIRSESFDARVDLFAVGVVLHELLTLKHLFLGSGGDIAAAYRVLEMPISAPSRTRGDVPRALDRVVMKALARDPAVRFQSAREMASALEPIIEAARWRQEDFVEFIAACCPPETAASP